MTPAKRPGTGARRGFTLVELLVAISILAIVAVLGWRGLDSIVRARETLVQQMEVTRGMQLAFAQMQSDCEHVADRTVIDTRPWLQVGGDRFTLVRQVFTENQPARLQVVAYRVVDGTLVRRESQGTRDLNQLDGLWQAALSDGDAGTGVVLQTGVTGMQISTWVGTAWRQAGVDASANAGATTETASQLAQQKLQQQANPNATSNDPTGLQVALQGQGQTTPMTKSFLLGVP